ncbi:MAG: hypothetical protein O3C40_18720 [Planctomycetota bacterium]|nr:hypothetical protein [Planctomycetota bacterium]
METRYVFLSESHPGIPDVEILDKLLHPGTVLLTGDCVLHERAIQQGIRSHTLSLACSLNRLLRAVSCLTLHPCVKGRFFDSMQRKLHQLDGTGSNELTRVDFVRLAGRLLMEDAEGRNTDRNNS